MTFFKGGPNPCRLSVTVNGEQRHGQEMERMILNNVMVGVIPPYSNCSRNENPLNKAPLRTVPGRGNNPSYGGLCTTLGY